MLCLSTRGQSPAIPLYQAIIEGIAPDGGLYLPEYIPQIDLNALLASETYQQVAFQVMAPFFAGDLLAEKLPGMIERAFNFPVPLKVLNMHETLINRHPRVGGDPVTPSSLDSRLRGDDVFTMNQSFSKKDFLLELFHGPTSAFKDVGARFLAECFAAVPTKSKTRTILVATSGDTGGAVAAAFHQHDNVRVVVLFPDGRVSARQAHQLSCFGDNIHSYRVQGSFDDCQRLVKTAFADKELSEQFALTSANSINLGRLLPQMSYYAWAAVQYTKTKDDRQALNFIIPSGNLGNAFAAILAKAAGAPIGDIVLATNANTVLPDFFDSGEYSPRDSIGTLANAMDVGAPSNLERLRYLYPDKKIHQAILRVESVSDDEIRRAIPVTLDRYDEIICPHTACGMVVLERLRDAGDSRSWCVVATAHPAKFETVVEPLIAQIISIPELLQTLLNRPVYAETLQSKPEALEEALKSLRD